ncbi:MAG: HDIG domain-containing protein [Caldilineaceae bacterium]|nr:HDIG domain-containing protein [Caldilineaceae bacterium]
MAATRFPISDRWFNRLLMALIVGAVAIFIVSLLAWQFPSNKQAQLTVGQVATSDISSPAQITYPSEVQTRLARERAAQVVPEQYDSTEGRVRRQQINRSREVLAFITAIRNDPYASPELQVDYLLAIAELELTPEAAYRVQSLSIEDWQAVVTETPLTLDRIMRDEIRESSLATARRRVPSLVDSNVNEAVSAATTELVRGLVRPNSIYNEERTQLAREQAREQVPIQYQTLERGETIIRAGDVATAEQVEALVQVGLLQPDWEWWILVRAIVLCTLMFGVVLGTIYRLRPSTMANFQELAALAVVFVIWMLAAKLMVVPHDWLPYLYPLAAMSMLIAVLIDLRVAMVVTMIAALLVHYFSNNNFIMVTYTGLGALLGAIVLGRAEGLSSFLWAGLAVALSNILIFASFNPDFVTGAGGEWLTQSLPLLLALILNGGLSASIALISYFVLGNVFNLTTSLQLGELSRPTQPLLRQLLLKAPGTYHHTIVVSNLAERAAAAIGADALLARVGAYYHDIGKTVRPYFFTENIADNSSPHEKLDPLTSAQIIISHVTDGIDLAQKYRLPPSIQDFIREHHGRSLAQYFYIQAQRQAEPDTPVDPQDFRYPGPNPHSKETAILLLADTCEAAVRAMRPGTREELEKFINKLIDSRVAEGVLNQCELTFKDLQTIREVFIHVLQGVHHPRVTYPEAAQTTSAATAKTAAAPPVDSAKAAANGSNGHARPEPAGNQLYRENVKETLGGVEEMEAISS